MIVTERIELRCLFGCTDNPAVFLIEFEEGGCICFKDRIQALCQQHWQTSEPIKGARVIATYPFTFSRLEKS